MTGQPSGWWGQILFGGRGQAPLAPSLAPALFQTLNLLMVNKNSYAIFLTL